ncbi:MAG: YigZ family protein [Phototrophicales bacterium]|nr:MAG: YigZ family protein [Phototrophicales bacterium]
MTSSYHIPKTTCRIEHLVLGSRFIATAGYAPSVERARALLQGIRAEMPDASHHVYAFRVGFGSSVIEGMSDDGEPAGTAGPPVLSVIRGSPIGDLIIVVTRYFGGKKLGTGGLVRVYTQAAQAVLAELPTVENVPTILFQIALPYSIFTRVEQRVQLYDATIIDKSFDENVKLLISMPMKTYETFRAELRDLSQGSVVPVIMD